MSRKRPLSAESRRYVTKIIASFITDPNAMIDSQHLLPKGAWKSFALICGNYGGVPNELPLDDHCWIGSRRELADKTGFSPQALLSHIHLLQEHCMLISQTVCADNGAPIGKSYAVMPLSLWVTSDIVEARRAVGGVR